MIKKLDQITESEVYHFCSRNHWNCSYCPFVFYIRGEHRFCLRDYFQLKQARENCAEQEVELFEEKEDEKEN